MQGSRGSVFQTGLPYRQETEGLKTTAIKEPFYGWGCIGMQLHHALCVPTEGGSGGDLGDCTAIALKDRSWQPIGL